MVILDLDAGNTRLKWRLLDHGVVAGEGAILTSGPDFSRSSTPGNVLESLFSEMARIPGRVRVSSVREPGFDAVIADSVSAHWQINTEFAKVTRDCAGVRNSYQDVSRMGVDRWMAMLAAYRITKGGCCVVGAGSALTVDMVAADGRHTGGYIVPGLQLMLSSLKQRSSALNYLASPVWEETGPGVNTAEAMEHGILDMATAWLEVLYSSYKEREWVITGGDAPALMAHLDWVPRHEPALVLDGLSVALP